MTRSVLTFILIAYGLSYTFAGVVGLSGGESSPYAWLLVVVMFVPTVAAWISRAVHRDGVPGEAWRVFPLKYAALGLVATPVVWGAAFVVGLVLLGPGLEWASWLTAGADGMIHPPANFGGEPFRSDELNSKLIGKLLINLLPLLVFTLGEEYGWRSFLQRRLEAHFGVRRGILWTAVIWAYFHLGIFLLDAGEVGPVTYWLGALVIAPAGLTAVGVFFGWLYHRSGSLMVVVLAHAANNKWGQIPRTYLEQPQDETGMMVVATLILATAGFLFYRSMPLR
jgi:membrane protease YdiL (CAAX protease family)